MGFPKIRGTFLGAPIIRTMVYHGLYWGPSISTQEGRWSKQVLNKASRTVCGNVPRNSVIRNATSNPQYGSGFTVCLQPPPSKKKNEKPCTEVSGNLKPPNQGSGLGFRVQGLGFRVSDSEGNLKPPKCLFSGKWAQGHGHLHFPKTTYNPKNVRLRSFVLGD